MVIVLFCLEIDFLLRVDYCELVIEGWLLKVGYCGLVIEGWLLKVGY
jgi:hypothetical protein